MNFESFNQLIKQVLIGKQLPDAIYLHKDAMCEIPYELQKFIPAVAKAVNLPDCKWNLVKLFKKEFRLSLLSYPDFYTDSYPSLEQSLNVDLSKLSHKITCYRSSDNPPILHRKETMISSSSEYFELFSTLTEEGEKAGLYENTRIIGFKNSWLNLIEQKGYQLVNGHLLKAKNTPQNVNTTQPSIDRYKTAIVRHELSGPMKTLAKQGYLDGSFSIFDYGCGRGDDLRELEAHGLDAIGWDPVFSPDNDKINSDIVNLGFVLNVIEDQDERLEALLSAWELADKLLIVSVMLANESYISQFKPYKDGVITSRKTFQKYYTQSEFKGYLERSLQDTPIAVAPGIFYIFKDKLEEQRYLQSKYQRHYIWKQITSPHTINSQDREKLIIIQNQELFNKFWNVCLELGRIPSKDEFNLSNEMKTLIGSHRKTFNILKKIFDINNFKKSEKSHKEDLLVYFAMGLFEKKKSYTQQPESLKCDIKALFGDYKTAINLAAELLFAIADTQLIDEQCVKAYKQLPASIINEGHSLIFHKKYIDSLPLLLRIYVGAALQMYGELDDKVDTIKIHINSGKLTLAHYDNFDKSVPYLIERIKIKMAIQDIDFFDYPDEPRRPPLLNKHLLLDNKHQQYDKQRSFDKRLSKILRISTTHEVILHRQKFEERLNLEGKKISNYKIIKY